MSHTNATAHYALSQFIASDTPGWMSDVNQDNTKIDTAIYNNETAITTLNGNMSTVNAKLENMLPDVGNVGTVLQKTTNGAVWSNLFNLIYPVGSIYMTEDTAFDPSARFGGTWVQIKDRFLLAAGDTYTTGDTGGEAEHTLTVSEMPQHTHKVLITSSTTSDQNWYYNYTFGNGAFTYNDTENATGVKNAGGSQPHNNMPPYQTVMIWKRTA